MNVFLRVGLFGALVAALVTVPGLWLGTLWDNSETAYSEVAREILLSHDAIVMHLNSAAWYIQPPLYFWLAAGAAKIWGSESSFAYRLPSAIATIVMSGALAMFVRGYTRSQTARYAACILATMLLQAVLGRFASMDALLDVFVMLTTLSGFIAVWPTTTPGKRAASAIFAAMCAALGVLTKGLVALLIPLLILIPWGLWERRFHSLVRPAPLPLLVAAGAFLCISLPWYLLLGIATGSHGLSELILHYTFGRYLGTIENQTGPFWYYVPVVLLGALPWTSFLLPALWQARPGAPVSANGNSSTLTRFGFVWTIVPFLFFSFAKTKLPNYVALCAPGMALLCAVWLEQALEQRRRRHVLIAAATIPLSLLALALGLIIYAHHLNMSGALKSLSHTAIDAVLAIGLGTGAGVLALRRRRYARWAPYCFGAGTIAAMLIIAFAGLAQAEQFKPIPPLAKIIMQVRQANDVIALQSVGGENALMFYTQPPIAVLASPDTLAPLPQNKPALVLCAAPRVLLVAPLQRPSHDPTYGRRRRLLASSLKDALYLIDGPPCNSPPA